MESIKLKTMCELLDVSRRCIQGYEHKGLMRPTGKNKYGHLLYDENTLRRAEMIRFLQQLGFSLEEIKEIIDAPNIVVKEALERRVKELESKKDHMDRIVQKAKEYIEKLSREDNT